jgi:hypothetical protein
MLERMIEQLQILQEHFKDNAEVNRCLSAALPWLTHAKILIDKDEKDA